MSTPEQATPGPGHPAVEGQDPEDGDGPDPVEAGDVGSGAPGRPPVLGQQVGIVGRRRRLRLRAGNEIHGRHG